MGDVFPDGVWQKTKDAVESFEAAENAFRDPDLDDMSGVRWYWRPWVRFLLWRARRSLRKIGTEMRLMEKMARSDAFPLGWARRRVFAELLIDCEEDRRLRAVLVGMLREAGR